MIPEEGSGAKCDIYMTEDFRDKSKAREEAMVLI